MLNKNKMPSLFGNDLLEISEDILVPQALEILHDTTVIGRLVFSDFGTTASEQGDKIKVILPVDLGEAEAFDENTGFSNADINVETTEITVDQHFGKQFAITDIDFTKAKTEGYFPNSAESAVKACSKAMGKYIYNTAYKQTPNLSGSVSTADFDKSTMLNAEKVLFDNLAPEGEAMFAGLNSNRYAQLLNDLVKVDENGSDEALRNASTGQVASFTVYRDTLLARLKHTNGTAKDSAMALDGAATKGDKIIVMTGASVGETVLEGDILEITLDDGEIEQVVCAADAVAGASTVSVSLAHAVKGEAAIGKAVVYANTEVSYDVNLGFQKNFYALVMRPLTGSNIESNEDGSTIVSQVDPRSGMSIRLESWRDSQLKKNLWSFDVLYGGKVVRPEFATRILG